MKKVKRKTLYKYWKAQRRQVKKGKISFHYAANITHGADIIFAFIPDLPFPVGYTCYSHVGRRMISIDDVYVVRQFRRCGITGRIQNELIRVYPKVGTFITAEGNRRSIPLMKKMGWKDTRIGWMFKVKR